MCAIAGILDSSGRAPQQAALQSMLLAMRHRGPDGSGLWWDDNGTAGLAHARLAVIDPTEAAAQPMHSACGRFSIVFNGEIYNHRALALELERQGVAPRTQSDTEVLLHLFAREGPKMLRRLHGMFAFCVWDRQQQSAMLARDSQGIKPLYYAQRGEGLQFASELKGLVAGGGLRLALDPQGLAGLVGFGSVPEPRTLLQGVRMLGAGEYLLWSRAGVSVGHFQCEVDAGAGDPAAAAWLREGLLESLQRHLVSDVPVGLLLSGGMDSTAMLALSREIRSGPLQTFTVGLKGAQDESALAARSAAHFGADHHVLELDQDAALELFEGFLVAVDQPTVDGFNVHVISNWIHRHGLKVALSGLGGDECFGGYPSFAKVPSMLAWHRRVGGALWQRWPSLPLSGRWRRLAEFMAGPSTAAAAYAALRGLHPAADVRLLVAAMLGGLPDLGSDAWLTKPAGEDVALEIAALESGHYMRNQLLRDADVFSMASGVEMRVPLVEANLAARLSRIPSGQRFAEGKALLLRAVPELPPWVLRGRGRRGFLFPYARWISGAWGQRLASASRGSPLPLRSWYQVWTLYVLREVLARWGLMSAQASLFDGELKS
jgi:asparagine synthase (glutamine-hydrolysing)